jgi:fucose permease
LLVVVVVTRSRLVSSLDLTSLLSSLSREFILLGFRVKLIHSSLFFLWGFAYGLLDVLNKKFQTVLGVTKLESTGLQVMYFGVGYLL